YVGDVNRVEHFKLIRHVDDVERLQYGCHFGHFDVFFSQHRDHQHNYNAQFIHLRNFDNLADFFEPVYELHCNIGLHELFNHLQQLHFCEFVKYLFDHSQLANKSRLVNIVDQPHIFDLYYFNYPDSCHINDFDRSINHNTFIKFPDHPDVNTVDLFELYRRVIWILFPVFIDLELVFVNRDYDLLFGCVYQQP
ncbi:hypothetical protein CMUS01_03855, partial [Colletotrichum musicola]